MRWSVRALPVLAVLLWGCAHAIPAVPVPGEVRFINAVPTERPRYLVVARAGGVEAYTLDGAKLTRVRSWPGASNYYLLGFPESEGELPNLLVETRTGAALYRPGRWEAPLLDAQALAVGPIATVRTLRPYHPADGAWRGLAVHEAAGTWRLFATDDGDSWHPLVVRGGPGEILEVKRVGPGQLAVRGSLGWSLHARSGDGAWERFPLAGMAGPWKSVASLDADHVLGLTAAGDEHPRWFVWDGVWLPLAEALPGAPATPTAVRSVVAETILAVRDVAGAESHYVRVGKRWRRLEEVVHGLPAHLATSYEFADHRGLVVTYAPTAEEPLPRVAAFVLREGRWGPLPLEGLAEAWSLVSEGPRAVWLRRPSATRWFVERGGSWLPLESLLPPGTHAPGRVLLDGSTRGLAVIEEHDEPDQPAEQQRIYLRVGDGYVPFQAAITTAWTPARLQGDPDIPESLVRLRDTAGVPHLLSHDGMRWVELPLEPGATGAPTHTP